MSKVLAVLILLVGVSAYAQNTPVRVQNTSTGLSSDASTLAFTSNVTSGNALYAVVFDGGGPGQTLSFTDSQNNTWTTIKSASLATDGDTIGIGCAIAGSSGADTVTFKVNGSTQAVAASVYEVSNATCTPDATPVSSDTTAQTACNSGSLTTATANDLLLGFCGLQHNQTLSAGSGWSYGSNAGTGGSPDSLGEIQIATTTGAYTATSATYSTSAEQATIEVAFKATTSGGGGGGGISGSGTAKTIAMFTGSSSLGNSYITTDSTGTLVGIDMNGSTPLRALTVDNGEILVIPATGSATGYLDVSDVNGNSGGNMTFVVRGLVSGGQTGAYLSTFQVDANNTVVTGNLVLKDGSVQTTAWTGVLCGGDYAEAVNTRGSKKSYEPGDVLVIGDGDRGEVQKSVEPYSTMVAGIFATKPGVIGRRQSLLKDADEIPMAMVGIVPTKVTAENGPIRRGDLLVSSSTKGYAMKGTDRNRLVGAVIGKAMGSLDSGTGVIEVLVTLQ
jgi:hypothetical protein